MVDWNKAEKHLSACENACSVLDSAGYLILNYVVYPLRDRFTKGERTKDLWREIMQTQI